MKSLNKKKTTPSTISKPTAKKNNYRFLDEYKDYFTYRKIPVSEAFLDKLAQDILQWAHNDETALVAEKFWYIKGIPIMSARKWRDRYPPLKQAYKDAVRRIGIRREEEALKKNFDSSVFRSTAFNYSPAFTKTTKWLSSLKKEENETTHSEVLQEIVARLIKPFPVPEDKNG